MDPPNLTSGSVQALLDRLRAAQSSAPPNDTNNNGTSQYQGYGQTMGDESGSSYSGYGNLSDAASSLSMTSGSNTFPPQHPQQPHSGFQEDLARSDSVQALLSSLQSARPPPEVINMNPSDQMMGYTNHYAPSTPNYQYQHPPQRQQPFPRPQYRPQNTQPFRPPQAERRPEQSYPRFDRSPTSQIRPTPSSSNSIPLSPSRRTWAAEPLPERPVRSPVPPDFSRPTPRPSASPRRSESTSPRVVKAPVEPIKAYDPYDEEYSPPPPDDPPSADDGSPEAENPSLVAEESAQKEEEASLERDREQEEAERKAERDTDDFVEMSFARASAIVTQLMNDEAVVRRLKELREEQENLERRLWEKRLEIVKMYREKTNEAKEEAKRMDQAPGDARVMKEKSAAQKALRQFYTTRCLPFYDDLHAKHLLIMQLELGIPGLGRLEVRRKAVKGVRGVAERPIAVDSDDDDEDEAGKEKRTVGREVQSEEAREKMLVRRRKIVGLVESIMVED